MTEQFIDDVYGVIRNNGPVNIDEITVLLIDECDFTDFNTDQLLNVLGGLIHDDLIYIHSEDKSLYDIV